MQTPTSTHVERDRGFSLIELMVVVVIIGVLAAVALPRIRPNAVQQGTTDLQALLYEAHRQAITLGPVPPGAHDSLGNTPDAMVQVVVKTSTATVQYFDIPYGTLVGSWVVLETAAFSATDPNAAQIFDVASTASYASGLASAPSSANTAGGVTLEIRSDGACTVGTFGGAGAPTGATLYVENNAGNADNQYRLVLFPIGATPIVLDSW